jgi:hypothetical protein
VFGLAALAFGLVTLAWHDYHGWHQPRYLVYAASAAQIFGGSAIQLRRSAKTGAIVLGAFYQRQAEGSKRRELRFDSGHRRHGTSWSAWFHRAGL